MSRWRKLLLHYNLARESSKSDPCWNRPRGGDANSRLLHKSDRAAHVKAMKEAVALRKSDSASAAMELLLPDL